MFTVAAPGVLEVGQTLVCQFVYEAGVVPHLFSGEVQCIAWPLQQKDHQEQCHGIACDHATNSGPYLQQQQLLKEVSEEVQEVIAQHPHRRVACWAAVGNPMLDPMLDAND
jgi:hypothetical protein